MWLLLLSWLLVALWGSWHVVVVVGDLVVEACQGGFGLVALTTRPPYRIAVR